MEIELVGRQFTPVSLPAGYRLISWSDSLLETHAETKYLSFRTEIDCECVPLPGRIARLLAADARNSPEARLSARGDWLGAHEANGGEDEYCGTIQGIWIAAEWGRCRIWAVVPDHRGLGLGTALMRQLLEGFQRVGLERVFLEVTCQNEGAIRLYRRPRLSQGADHLQGGRGCVFLTAALASAQQC